MSAYPQDIIDVAQMTWGQLEEADGIRECILTIAIALHSARKAERERCAKIAEAGLVCRSCGHVGEITECCDRMNFDGATNAQIAAAIRNPKP